MRKQEQRVNRYLLALLASLALSGQVAAVDEQPREKGIEGKGYVWNEMQEEKLQALRAKGDAARGEIAFEVCQGCHRAGAVGRLNGTYPRLAGQHATVLIKQMTDVRAGRRDNPKMYPFADKHVLEPQDIADIAIYLQGLPSPPNNGKGKGEGLAKAKKKYDADCASCHGKAGMGDSDKFYPRVAGQHYLYLLRESLSIRDGQRRNAFPKMVKLIKGYSDADIAAVADYMSRFDTQ
jgi:cytochrome c553